MGIENQTENPSENILYFADATRLLNTKHLDNSDLNPLLIHMLNVSKEERMEWLPEKDPEYNKQKLDLLNEKVEQALETIKVKAMQALEKKNKNRVKTKLSVGDLVLIRRFSPNKNLGRFHQIPERILKVSQFIVITENILNGVRNIRHRSDVKQFTKIKQQDLPIDIQMLRLHFSDHYLDDLYAKQQDDKPVKRVTRQRKDNNVQVEAIDDDDDDYEVDFIT